VLDPTVTLCLAQLAIRPEAVELQQPVLEARLDLELSGPDLVGAWIPGDSRFGTRASRGGAHGEDLLQCGGSMWIVVNLTVDYLPCRLNQLRKFQGCRTVSARAAGRAKLEGTESAPAHIREPVKRRDVLRGHTLACHPGIDEAIPEVIGKGVS